MRSRRYSQRSPYPPGSAGQPHAVSGPHRFGVGAQRWQRVLAHAPSARTRIHQSLLPHSLSFAGQLNVEARSRKSGSLQTRVRRQQQDDMARPCLHGPELIEINRGGVEVITRGIQSYFDMGNRRTLTETSKPAPNVIESGHIPCDWIEDIAPDGDELTAQRPSSSVSAHRAGSRMTTSPTVKARECRSGRISVTIAGHRITGGPTDGGMACVHFYRLSARFGTS